MHTDEIKTLLDSIKRLPRGIQIQILNEADRDGNTCLMRLAITGETDVPNGIAIATQQLIDAGINITYRNNRNGEWLNALDIALLNKPEMVEPLLRKAATLCRTKRDYFFALQNYGRELEHYLLDRRGEIFSICNKNPQNLSDVAMDYVEELNTYINRQFLKFTRTQDPVDANKMRCAMNALQALVSKQNLNSESTRVANMRAILKRGDDALSHRQSGGFFKKTSDGEKLFDLVGVSQEGTEMSDLKGYKHKEDLKIDTTDGDDSDDEADERTAPLI